MSRNLEVNQPQYQGQRCHGYEEDTGGNAVEEHPGFPENIPGKIAVHG